MANISIKGLADTSLNTEYVYSGLHDGYPYYKSNDGSLIIYKNSYMPYCTDPAYYIIKKNSFYGALNIMFPKYICFSTDVLNGTWSSLMSNASGENILTNFVTDYVSSSSLSSWSSLSTASSSLSSSSSLDERFISIWDTTKTSTGSSANNQVKLPLVSNGTYNFIVGWGDGNSNIITTYNQAEVTHTYGSTGVYTISITGICDGWSFSNSGDRLKILNISQWGPNFKLGNNGSYFQGCSNFNITASDIPNLTGTTSFYQIFTSCSSLNPRNIGNWDVSNITNMERAFQNCSTFNRNLNSWDFSNVTNMGQFTYGCSSFNNGGLPGTSPVIWNTSKATFMRELFRNCSVFNQYVNGIDTTSVVNYGIYGWFYSANNFNNGEVTNTGSRPLTLNVSNATSLSSMFYSPLSHKFNQPLLGWDTSKVTDMSYFMAASPHSFNSPMTNPSGGVLNTSSVTNMSNMFNRATSFKQDISGFNISSLTNASNMFANMDMNDSDTTTRYDTLLNAWANKTKNNNVSFSGGLSKYSSDASSARAILVSAGWTVTDGGLETDFSSSSSKSSIELSQSSSSSTSLTSIVLSQSSSSSTSSASYQSRSSSSSSSS